MSDVKLSGPLFDGRAERALSDGLAAARKAVAKEGASRAREYLTASTEEGTTGRAERAVTYTDHSVVMVSGKYVMPVVVDDPRTYLVVTSSLASYGPWLEGTGSRNQTTRFKGYRSFQMAAQLMQSFAGNIADDTLQRYFGQMS